MQQLNSQEIPKLNKFITDPDWVLIERIIRSYIEPLRDINKIKLDDESAVVKAEIKVRLEMINSLETFLKEARLLSETLNRDEPDFE